MNLYTYCWNNPIIYVDSTGNKPRVFKQANQAYKASGAEEMTKTFLDAFSTPDTQTMTIEFTNKNGELQSISYEGLSNEAIISMATGPSSKIAKGAKAAVIAGQEVKAVNAAKKVVSSTGTVKLNLSTLDTKFLKSNGIDPHKFKSSIIQANGLKDKSPAHYNIFRDKKTKELYLVPNDKTLAPIATGKVIK